jgi:hypothetical protein
VARSWAKEDEEFGRSISIKLRKEEVKRNKGKLAFGDRIQRENDLTRYFTERSL